MKKLLALAMSLGCLLAAAAMVVPTKSDLAENSIVMTATAADDDPLPIPGSYAEKYKYKFADSSVYTTTISKIDDKALKGIVFDKNGETDEEKMEKGIHYAVYTINVRHQEYDEKEKKVTVKDITENRLGFESVDGTILDLKVNEAPIKLPEEFKDVEIVDRDKVTVIPKDLFKGSYLKTIDLTGVEYIGVSAFAKCQFITEIEIPASCKFIGASAFQDSGLKTLIVNCELPVIPESFCANTALTKITLAHPEMLRLIQAKAFKDTPISEPLFGKDVKDYELMTIDDSAYENCTAIKEVNMPANLINLEKNVFRGCTNISTVVVGDNVYSMDAECFANCTALDSIEFKPSVKSLGGGIFSGCTSLKSADMGMLTIKDWVEVTSNTGYGFGNNMFANCTALQYVNLPKTITKVPESCFAGCIALGSNPEKPVDNDTNIVAIADSAFSGCSKLPAIKYSNVTSIGASAFKGCSEMEKAELPETTEIFKAAFSGCSKLAALKFPKCTFIGVSAFSDCSAATEFEAGVCKSRKIEKKDNPGVGEKALENCSSLPSIKLISDTYGDYVFKNCAAATAIDINCDDMTKTPVGLFSSCAALTKVTSNGKSDENALSKIQIISNNTFEKCAELVEINFPSLRIIESNAFADCVKLKKICNGAIIVEDYGEKCFKNCSALDAKITGDISTIGASAFQNSGVTEVAVNGMVGGTIVIGKSAFADCEKLKSASIQSPQGTVFKVGDEVFSNCPNLASAKFAGPIITKGMFKGCTMLKTAELAGTSISASAFDGCASLEKLTSLDPSVTTYIAKEVGSGAFNKCVAMTQLPADSKTTYTGTGQYQDCATLETAEVGLLTKNMFSGCLALKNVKLTDDIVAVPSGAFKGCEALGSIQDLTGKEIGVTRLQEIGSSAFSGTALKKVETTGASIESGAFSSCVQLENVKVNGGTVAASAFENCIALTKADVTADSIGGKAFAGCTALKEANVTTGALATSVFSGDTELAQVNIKNTDTITLKQIGTNVFYDCPALKSLNIPGSPTVAAKGFGYNSKGVVKDFYVICEAGSNVEKFAKDHNIAYTNDPSKAPVIATETTAAATTTKTTTTTAAPVSTAAPGSTAAATSSQAAASTTTTSGKATAGKKGDVNNDNQVTVSDAIMLARIVAEDATVKITDQGKANAELDGEEGLTAADTTILLKMLAGLV